MDNIFPVELLAFFFVAAAVRIVALCVAGAAAARQAEAFRRKLEQIAQSGQPNGASFGPAGPSVPPAHSLPGAGNTPVLPGIGGATSSGVYVGVSPKWKR